MKADGHTGKDIAKYLGVSRATRYRYLQHMVSGRDVEIAHQLSALASKPMP